MINEISDNTLIYIIDIEEDDITEGFCVKIKIQSNAPVYVKVMN